MIDALLKRVEIAYSDIEYLTDYVHEKGPTIGPCRVLLEESALLQIRFTIESLVKEIKTLELEMASLGKNYDWLSEDYGNLLDQLPLTE